MTKLVYSSFPSFAYWLVEVFKRNVFLWSVNYTSQKKKQVSKIWTAGDKKRESKEPVFSSSRITISWRQTAAVPFSQAMWSSGFLRPCTLSWISASWLAPVSGGLCNLGDTQAKQSTSDWLNSSSIAVVTNHKLSGFKQHKCITSQFYRLEVRHGSHRAQIKVVAEPCSLSEVLR